MDNYLDLTNCDLSKAKLKKYSKERIVKGYSIWDIGDMDEWFLHIIPDMLTDLIKHSHEYPAKIAEVCFQDTKNKYYKIFKDEKFKPIVKKYLNVLKTNNEDEIVHFLVTRNYIFEDYKIFDNVCREFENDCIKKWHSILNKIIQCFKKTQNIELTPSNYKKVKRTLHTGFILLEKYLFSLWF